MRAKISYVFVAIVLALSVCVGLCRAEEMNVNLKQGFVYSWKHKQVKNLTTFEIAKTRAVESIGKWNALLEGWSIDAGGAYDTNVFNGVLLLGREFGTLGKYLPIDFPLKDKISITLYPIGLYVRDIFNSPDVTLASGVGIIKISLKF
ncbi:MAG: hypothetical protein QME16_00025 [Planctomycetota bacterium]|nr:hypothetical protein [Planctomycetota bacterium]